MRRCGNDVASEEQSGEEVAGEKFNDLFYFDFEKANETEASSFRLLFCSSLLVVVVGVVVVVVRFFCCCCCAVLCCAAVLGLLLIAHTQEEEAEKERFLMVGR